MVNHILKFTQSFSDTLVWRDKLGYNEPYVTQYLRHPAYRNYPVVGVNSHKQMIIVIGELIVLMKEF